MITISVAGLNVGIDNRYKGVQRRCRDYLTDAEPEFCVCATEEDIERERQANLPRAFRNGYLEFICVYREIARRLPAYDAFLMHGASLMAEGKGFLFTAPSGTGKSTHTNLWAANYPGTVFINGDKPIIRKIDGRFMICGTPWQGKENFGNPIMAPASGVCLLTRGEENSIAPILPEKIISALMHQIFLPENPEMRLKMLELYDEFLRSVPVFRLTCNMEQSAAAVSYEAMVHGII